MWMVTWDAHAVHVYRKATVHVVNDRMCHLQRLRQFRRVNRYVPTKTYN